MAKKKALGENRYHCRDCSHSYGWHEKNLKGELFMCKCPHYKGGMYSKFLSDVQCDKFMRRIGK